MCLNVLFICDLFVCLLDTFSDGCSNWDTFDIFYLENDFYIWLSFFEIWSVLLLWTMYVHVLFICNLFVCLLDTLMMDVLIGIDSAFITYVEYDNLIVLLWYEISLRWVSSCCFEHAPLSGRMICFNFRRHQQKLCHFTPWSVNFHVRYVSKKLVWPKGVKIEAEIGWVVKE